MGHGGDLRDGVSIPVPPKKTKTVLIAESVKESADGCRELFRLIIRFHVGCGWDTLFQLVQYKIILAVSLACGIAVVFPDSKIAGDPADIADQWIGVLGRD